MSSVGKSAKSGVRKKRLSVPVTVYLHNSLVEIIDGYSAKNHRSNRSAAVEHLLENSPVLAHLLPR